MRRWPSAACLALVLGCAPLDEPDRGPIEATLSAADRVAWPGLDTASGRVVPLVSAFGNERPSAYWFFGVDRRRTTDVFWFCREDDEACPLDEHRRVAWDRVVGQPLFSRIPGDPEYSHYWLLWVVRVPETFEPDSITTIGTLFDEDAQDRVRVELVEVDFGAGPQRAIMNGPMVLAGTELEGNGGPMPDGSGPMLRAARHEGWRQGYRVSFYDLTPLEGVFPEAPDSEGRPLMPTANLYVLWRDGASGPQPVSELGRGRDLTGDGDSRDTNNVAGSLQCQRGRAQEPPYSPAWAVHRVDILADLELVDTSGDDRVSEVMSATRLHELVEAGALAEPVPQPLDSSGAQALFNCPVPVAVGFVPFPCR